MVRRGDADEDTIVGLYENWHAVDLPAQDVAMLEYVEKLTLQPARMVEQDIQLLRKAGFSDEQITDIAMLTGYRAMLNRLHDGLGLTLDSLIERSGEAFVARFPGAEG